ESIILGRIARARTDTVPARAYSVRMPGRRSAPRPQRGHPTALHLLEAVALRRAAVQHVCPPIHLSAVDGGPLVSRQVAHRRRYVTLRRQGDPPTVRDQRL